MLSYVYQSPAELATLTLLTCGPFDQSVVEIAEDPRANPTITSAHSDSFGAVLHRWHLHQALTRPTQDASVMQDHDAESRVCCSCLTQDGVLATGNEDATVELWSGGFRHR